MAAFVTDQFRILNASNFVDSVSDENNSYYALLKLTVFMNDFLKRSENEKALLSLFQTADLSIQDALRDIGDSAVSRKVTDKFFRINLLAQVTQFSRNMALQAARRQTADDIKVLAEEAITGNITKKTIKPTIYEMQN